MKIVTDYSYCESPADFEITHEMAGLLNKDDLIIIDNREFFISWKGVIKEKGEICLKFSLSEIL